MACQQPADFERDKDHPTHTVPSTSASHEASAESMPSPFRMRLESAVELNATCVRCHVEEAREWQSSYHGKSATNPAFREAFGIEQVAFCRGCHVPEADPAHEPPAAVADIGVSCVTCHVTEPGTVLAALTGSPERLAEPAPHPVQRSAAFSATGGCKNCHEFRFPVPGGGDDDEHFMQTTVREHARSPMASVPCASCHMPPVDGHRSHAFSETRSPVWMAGRLNVTAERIGDHGVRLTLRQTTPGHGFPTGDLFRRLEVGAELRTSDGRVLDRDVRYLARHFDLVPGKFSRQLTLDDRVFAQPEEVELDLSVDGAAENVVTAWWVKYQRVATPGTGRSPLDARVESEIELHAGELR